MTDMTGKRCLVLTGLHHHYEKLIPVFEGLEAAGVEIVFMTSQNWNTEYTGDFELSLIKYGIGYRHLHEFYDESVRSRAEAEAHSLRSGRGCPGSTWDNTLSQFTDQGLSFSLHEYMENMLLMERALESIRPDFAMVLHECNFWTKPFTEVCRDSGVPLYSFQESHFPDTFIRSRVLCFAGNSHKLFLWGETMRDLFNSEMPAEDRYQIVGPSHLHRLMETREEFSRNDTLAEMGLDRKKKTLGFFVPTYMADLNESLNVFLELIRSMPGWQGVLKFRQNVHIDAYNRLKRLDLPDIHLTYDADPYPLILASDIVITGNSTVGIESLIFDTPMIFIDGNDVYGYGPVSIHTTSMLQDGLSALRTAILEHDGTQPGTVPEFLRRRAAHLESDNVADIVEIIAKDVCGPKPAVPRIESVYEMPLVSVVIPAYNRSDLLPMAVASAAKQTYPEVEVIVVDDGSTDGTHEAAQQLARTVSGAPVMVLRKVNGGVADARNYGIRHAKGEWVLPLDSDDTLEKDYVESAMAVIRTRPATNLVYGNVNEFGHKPGVWIPEPYTAMRILHENTMPYASIFRRSLWEAAGGYSVELGKVLQLEDWEMWIRMSRLGLAPRRIDRFMLNYRTHEENYYHRFIVPNFDVGRALIATSNSAIYHHAFVLNGWERIAGANEFIRERIVQTRAAFPKSARVAFWAGLVEERLNGHMAALPHFIEAGELDGEDWQYPFKLSQVYGKAGLAKKAEDARKRAVERLPKLRFVKG